jgi:hypothetical protein
VASCNASRTHPEPSRPEDGKSECVTRLSIRPPVYNGETYLAESLGALLSQSYEDFELPAVLNNHTVSVHAAMEG